MHPPCLGPGASADYSEQLQKLGAPGTWRQVPSAARTSLPSSEGSREKGPQNFSWRGPCSALLKILR